ncbi:hypothetical protein [Nitrospirillum iridis]|uniref:Hpr(Ser) kinase/phosphatase n=1 Tax=Nitrospirillum iridis TaxID=765888 RepID=A0A7X0EGL0_9PROT|nr:hypothetical protein [Nitrospirillum iridis]MBB6253709.1 hypothetical protein [Nitrospirillum iridis]
MTPTVDCCAAADGPADRTLCGLRVLSELPLPELRPWTGGGRPADLSIRLGDVPDHLEDGVVIHPLVQVAPDGRCRFALAAVGAYLISSDGREVIIAPAPNATGDEIRTFLFGTVFAVVCHRRGLLPLHACCVQVGDKAVAFAGDSGVGKSTLAATLWTRGYPLLADDVTVVDMNAPDGPRVLPAFPRVKLWRDSLERLGRSVDGLGAVRASLDKYHLPVEEGFCATSLPLAGVVQLEKNRKVPPGIRLLPVTQGLGRLNMVLYRPRLMLRLGTQAQQMAQFLRLLGSVGGLRALRRPETPAEWDEVEALLPALAG